MLLNTVTNENKLRINVMAHYEIIVSPQSKISVIFFFSKSFELPS